MYYGPDFRALALAREIARLDDAATYGHPESPSAATRKIANEVLAEMANYLESKRKQATWAQESADRKTAAKAAFKATLVAYKPAANSYETCDVSVSHGSRDFSGSRCSNRPAWTTADGSRKLCGTHASGDSLPYAHKSRYSRSS